MTGVIKHHQKNMRKSKAQLVEELEALEHGLAVASLGPGGTDDTAAGEEAKGDCSPASALPRPRET